MSAGDDRIIEVYAGRGNFFEKNKVALAVVLFYTDIYEGHTDTDARERKRDSVTRFRGIILTAGNVLLALHIILRWYASPTSARTFVTIFQF